MQIDKKQFEFTPKSGSLLVSEPFLSDPNFRKTVVLLCEHEAAGSFGFVLNKLLDLDTDEVVPELLEYNFPIYYGGPVEPNTLHFIHRKGEMIADSFPIGEDVFWGGDIHLVDRLIQQGVAKPEDFKFFIGYSGWGEAQLNAEIEQKAWWLTSVDSKIVFSTDLAEMWPSCVKKLGPDFAYLAGSPDDLLWN
jgi:putative transcriptional regulator